MSSAGCNIHAMSRETLPSRAWSCNTLRDGGNACQVISGLKLSGGDLTAALKDGGGVNGDWAMKI